MAHKNVNAGVRRKLQIEGHNKTREDKEINKCWGGGAVGVYLFS
jgi:hypothetical protein